VTGQAYAHLAWQRGTHWLREVGTPRLTGTNDWQQLTVTATAPADADSVVISMNLARSKVGMLPSKTDGGVISFDPSPAKSIWCEVVAE